MWRIFQPARIAAKEAKEHSAESDVIKNFSMKNHGAYSVFRQDSRWLSGQFFNFSIKSETVFLSQKKCFLYSVWRPQWPNKIEKCRAFF